ncbi:MAG: TonB family protein [Prevotellaceae bacterium]|jgi:TonB family protein|nr:TonB family protein [Prevotellaceae bacterium]
MGLFFVYILKSAVCLAVFYLFYRLLLSRETFHSFNRVALLGILLLSFSLPLIEVTVGSRSGMNQVVLTVEQWLLLMTPVSVETMPVEAARSMGWVHIALLIYAAGVLFFLLRHIYSLIRLGILIRTGRRECITPYYNTSTKVSLIVHDRSVAPFSWMHYIVLSRRDLNESGREILAHEVAHIRRGHSYDLLVADLAIFFQWFNPAAWLLKQELQNIHEYEADETVIKQGIDAQQYQLLLIKKAVGTRLYSMTNSFNHSKLKKRITMMKREKSNQWARAKYFYVLPLAAVAVTAFARPEVSAVTSEISAVKVTDLTTIVETKAPETPAVTAKDTLKPRFVPVPVQERQGKRAPDELRGAEKMPEYPGGMQAMAKYLRDNVRNTAETGKGRVTVRCTIGKNGKVSGVEVVRSLNKAADAEAVRVVKAMPKWIPAVSEKGDPVSATYTIPVAFGPTDAEIARAIEEQTGKTVLSVTRTDSAPAPVDPSRIVVYSRKTGEPVTEKPLVIVNGHEVSNDVMNAIDPAKIASISVLKNGAVLAMYGERGKNGVISITLKSEEGEYGPTLHFNSSPAESCNGMVLDKKGEPIVGAVVVSGDEHHGAVTDKEGKFSISVPEGTPLKVSYVGFKSNTAPASKKMIVVLADE